MLKDIPLEGLVECFFFQFILFCMRNYPKETVVSERSRPLGGIWERDGDCLPKGASMVKNRESDGFVRLVIHELWRKA